ncbi:MAG TPA: hypothetical protein VJH94_00185 [Candidatus Paceibacterota bacterium]
MKSLGLLAYGLKLSSVFDFAVKPTENNTCNHTRHNKNEKVFLIILLESVYEKGTIGTSDGTYGLSRKPGVEKENTYK